MNILTDRQRQALIDSAYNEGYRDGICGQDPHDVGKKDSLTFRLPCAIGDKVYTIGKSTFPCPRCKFGPDCNYRSVNCQARDRNGYRPCPDITILRVREHTCEAFVIDERGLSEPGHFDYEEFENFTYDAVDAKWYKTIEEAEAALQLLMEKQD